MISGLAIINLLIFALEIEDVINRLLCAFTTILNVVAFKLNYALWLPKISYNTLIDYYLVENFILLAIMALFAIIPYFYLGDVKETETADSHRRLSGAVEHEDKYAKFVNLITLYASIFMIVMNLLAWFIKVRFRLKAVKQLPKLELLDDQQWYVFRFSNPHYLPKVDLPPSYK